MVEHSLGLKTRHTNLKNGDNQQMLLRWALYIIVQQITNKNDKQQQKSLSQQTAKQ